ncbi:altronate hydrolase [Photobacterium sanctipauli]|uniref:Altronate hydrolase n=1 Tax=Photobacterium sanctipauli TaxID=1342794 RepID=A0A2T3NPB0_9GAMM|nr:UxaA family hydrolase [Photobacterium sanctipauli]PSW18091.1 altronate hydrolase [Photobacterium sanctipauli]
MSTFKGYPRPNGSFGIRNHILIIAVDECCEGIARNISNEVKGSIVVTNYNTCMLGGNEEMIDTMIHTGINPNVAGVLVIAMGCGSIDPELVAAPIRETGLPAHSMTVIKSKGTRTTINEGIALGKELEGHANSIECVDVPVSELVIGVKCGGSDTSSGIASNPSVGAAVDKMVDMGATCMAGELIELIGCEDILRERAVSTDVADKICKLIEEEEHRWHVEGTEVETMSIGNSVGGLTTIDEKSHGAMHKTCTRAIQDVLRINHLHREKPTKPGFYLTETTHLCGSAAMHFASLGAHMILWTSGGAGFNNAITPVIRVSGNEHLITEDMDINACGIMKATDTIDNVSNEIVKKINYVANGGLTNIEGVGFAYASLYQKDQRLERVLNIYPE